MTRLPSNTMNTSAVSPSASLAPVALFVYNRTDNMMKTLDCLVHNTLAAETDLYVFSDGGKDDTSWRQVNEVRRKLREFREKVGKEGCLKSMTIVEMK